MTRRAIKIFAIMVTAFIAACDNPRAGEAGGAAPMPASEMAPVPVFTVDAVSAARVKGEPGTVLIQATGTVRTGGWKNPLLRPLETFAAEKGMRSFTLAATPPAPDLFVTQALVSLQATLRVENVPADVKTIWVNAETNRISAAIAP